MHYFLIDTYGCLLWWVVDITKKKKKKYDILHQSSSFFSLYIKITIGFFSSSKYHSLKKPFFTKKKKIRISWQKTRMPKKNPSSFFHFFFPRYKKLLVVYKTYIRFFFFGRLTLLPSMYVLCTITLGRGGQALLPFLGTRCTPCRSLWIFFLSFSLTFYLSSQPHLRSSLMWGWGEGGAFCHTTLICVRLILQRKKKKSPTPPFLLPIKRKKEKNKGKRKKKVGSKGFQIPSPPLPLYFLPSSIAHQSWIISVVSVRSVKALWSYSISPSPILRLEPQRGSKVISKEVKLNAKIKQEDQQT